jgi:c-di-GMP-related signal transduction protein
LHELHRENLDFDALEQVIKQDVALSYTLLNRVNTAFYGQRQTISSLHHALSLLGEREIRRWASLVVLNTLGRDQPHELLVTSLVRASFCESLAAPLGLPGKTAGFFLMGLLSLLDVFVGRPMEEIMEDMPLGMEVKSALTGGHNQHRNILDLVLNYEKGDIEQFLLHAAQLRLDETLITDLYLQAIDRAEDALQIYGSRPPQRT